MTVKTNYNPDVLSCLANLSNDEVFTPPALANQMLDALPDELWKDKNAKFLDPVCKSGVFLREIARRLIDGLEDQIPDLQERINHIYKNQLYGIAITELTSLLSRRSLYCSRSANGKYSVGGDFENEQGNIIFDRIDHTWETGKCVFCSASQTEYDRGGILETHAYQFIHTEEPSTLFNMKFDVIVGNPPYQLSDAGFKKSASPLYHKFVRQAMKLNPRYLTMIIPSRWFAGGKGLDDFRSEMLNDRRVRSIVDFENAADVFPGVDIAGGVCYFLWNRDLPGPCEVVNRRNNDTHTSSRELNEFPTFIRHSPAVPIIRKILSKADLLMNTRVSSRKPFGLATDVKPMKKGDIALRWLKGEGPYERKKIVTGTDLIDKWKVITSYVGYDHAGSPGRDGTRKVFSRIEILPPGTICTETYLVIDRFDTEKEAQNLVSYMRTRFFRFLVSQFMYSHHITKESYGFVPVLSMNISWSDEKLQQKFNLSQNEVKFISSMIRPM